MMEGIVVRVMREKRYGFIRKVGIGSDAVEEYFFHADDVQGFFEDIVEDLEMKRTVKVTFEPISSPKGLRASVVVPVAVV